ncbi:hypothetical protein [Sinisalibacter lacisalsi]|uniref:DUF2059 domain-containing protein n=1 Tax=Sinisalibacter lacisalsi TaxID=1526570 RepID=A0ABQ1QL95_9RHOB|nr:hypothetical protein [Sinisalibacter lacisalsi]GGD30602.1 hypothetical protein GCM10011358_13310 [Sinisalibacter lacisalsi]
MRVQGNMAGALVLAFATLWGVVAGAADRAEYRQFLEVTGFDVAITSMQQGAMAGPGIAGDAPDAFGRQYTALARRVFDPELMLDRAVEMMEAVLPEPLLEHGMDFYGSELGRRLVAVENESHVTEDDVRHEQGREIVERLGETNPARLEDYSAMMDAIGGVESSLRAVIEVQLRYLLAAMAAGSVDIDYSEAELRALLEEQAPEIRSNIALYSMLGAAYTYRDMSDADIEAYRAALEDPAMMQVYEILNAIQFQVMAERYEALAEALAGLTPEQEI